MAKMARNICTDLRYKQNLHTHTTYADGKDAPEAPVLKAMGRGFGAVITSDRRDKEFIDCHFAEAEALLSAAGFRS